jgi:hypothetical protein
MDPRDEPEDDSYGCRQVAAKDPRHYLRAMIGPGAA